MTKSSVWGPLTTILFSFLIYSVSGAVQIFASFFYLDPDIFEAEDAEIPDIDQLMNNGSATALSLGLASIICCVLILLIIRFKAGSRLKDYLALHTISLQESLKWIGLGLVCLAVVQVLFAWLPSIFGYLAQNDDALAEYNSADNLIFYYLTIVILVPIFEELLFRGFLFKGLLDTALGAKGTIALTALLFAGIHAQYELLTLLNVFTVGIFLGYARYKSGSLFPPLLIHISFNLLAMLQSHFLS